jgi:hypothetical protein
MAFAQKIDGLVRWTGTYDLDGKFRLREISAPATPPANSIYLYSKDVSSVSTLFYIDDAGVEHSFGLATSHDLLSATHPDTTAGTVARGDLVVGQGATPKWVRLAKGTANQVFMMDASAVDALWRAQSAIDHGSIGGLTDDDHTGYALLAGRASGQTLKGGTAASETLTLMSTNHATKGKVLFGTSGYDEVNNRLGLGTQIPLSKLHIDGATGGWILQDEQDSDPTTTELDASDSIAIYNKSNKLVVAYNLAGTINYLTIPLDGATTTFTQGTVAP